ncbi:MAG: tyrosine-type recombinase/integrase [Dermatophilaceae bacterium]
MSDLTYDVKIWTTRVYQGKRGNKYVVRWEVANKERARAHLTKKLAESFRSSLLSAARQGNAFDVATGLPEHMARQLATVTWYEHAMAFVDMKWTRASPRHRKSIAEALATVTPALVSTDRGAPSPEMIRHTLYQWSFNTAARSALPDEEMIKVDAWLRANSLPLAQLSLSALVRSALDLLAVRLDGKPAAHATVARKRAVFYGALRYAVELDHLVGHPMDRVSWTTPKADDEIDSRVVVNPTQAAAILQSVGDIDQAMVGFFACMYYAALRPGEVLHLRGPDCTLPEAGWGELLLTGSTQYTGSSWGDNGNALEDRALKHRASRSTRRVPVCPELVRILRHHMDTYACGPDGRLFVTRTGTQRHPVSGGYAGPVSGSSYGNTWRKARAAALTTAEVASPLARRPYDLRHACVSLWLNAGVPATQVAEWAGHSVAVLLRVYAKCIVGQEDSARQRIDAALGT